MGAVPLVMMTAVMVVSRSGAFLLLLSMIWGRSSGFRLGLLRLDLGGEFGLGHLIGLG